MKTVHMITFLLVIVGALNWGFVGIFDFNLVTYLLGDSSIATKIVYSLVGLSAIGEIILHPGSCKMCK